MKVIFRSSLLAFLTIAPIGQIFSMNLLKYLGYPYQQSNIQQSTTPVTQNFSIVNRISNHMTNQKIFITTNNNNFIAETITAGKSLDLAAAKQVHQNITDPFLAETAKNHGIKLRGSLKIYIVTPAGFGEVSNNEKETQLIFLPFSQDKNWSVIATKAKQVQINVNNDGSITFTE